MYGAGLHHNNDHRDGSTTPTFCGLRSQVKTNHCKTTIKAQGATPRPQARSVTRHHNTRQSHTPSTRLIAETFCPRAGVYVWVGAPDLRQRGGSLRVRAGLRSAAHAWMAQEGSWETTPTPTSLSMSRDPRPDDHHQVARRRSASHPDRRRFHEPLPPHQHRAGSLQAHDTSHNLRYLPPPHRPPPSRLTSPLLSIPHITS